jgi:hypothetical protein
MKTIYRTLLLVLVTIIISSCSGSKSEITHIIVKSDRHGVLLDTHDKSILSKLQPLFDEKVEAPDAGPDFFYFIDITINENTERWQYSEEGFIRNYEEGFTMIYLVRDVAEFNKIAKIR